MLKDNSKANIKLAQLMMSQNNFHDAAVAYKRAITIEPEQSPRVYIDLANALSKTDRLDEAIATCQQAIKLYPKNSLVYRTLGVIQRRTKDVEGAIASYKQAITLQPEQPPWVYSALGKCLRQLNRLDEAIAAYTEALRLKSEQPTVYAGLGNAHYKQGDFPSAIASYQKAIELNPEQPFWVYQQLGDALNEQDRLDEAIAAYQKFIELKPDSPMWVYANLGDTLARQGDAFVRQKQLKEAIASYQKALSTVKNLSIMERVYLKLAHIQREQGLPDEAERSYQKAITHRYLVNHKYKIIYCPIQKNASTLFKTMIVEHSDDLLRYEQSNQGIHTYIERADTGVRLADFSYLTNQDYFKFVILRNPFNRLVSAYLDQFVKYKNPQPFAKQVIKNVYKYLNLKPNIIKSITFQQFIDYLARSEDCDLNEHWRPQHTFLGLGLFQFDLIVQFENLDIAIEDLEKRFKIKIKTNISQHHKAPNRITNYRKYNSNHKFHDKYPEELRTLDNFPDAKEFYPTDLEEIVRKRYAKDIEIYEQCFLAHI